VWHDQKIGCDIKIPGFISEEDWTAGLHFRAGRWVENLYSARASAKLFIQFYHSRKIPSAFYIFSTKLKKILSFRSIFCPKKRIKLIIYSMILWRAAFTN
jgi:hypothetical protein